MQKIARKLLAFSNKLFLSSLLFLVTVSMFVYFQYEVQEGKYLLMLGNILIISIGLLIVIFAKWIPYQLLMQNALIGFGCMLLIDLLITVIYLIKEGRVCLEIKYIFLFMYILCGNSLLKQFEGLGKRKQLIVTFMFGESILLSAVNSEKAVLVILVVSFIVMFWQFRRYPAGKMLLFIGCMLIVGISLCLVKTFLFGLEYEKGRILSVFKENANSMQLQAQSTLSIFRADFIGQTVDNMIEGGSSSYFFSYIAGHFGLLLVLIILSLYLLQMAVVLQTIKDYKQPFAVIYPLLVIYTFRVIYSIGMNLSIFPATSIGLPFLCSEPGSFLFDCMSVGFWRKYYLNKGGNVIIENNIN
uniref:hypothetical protein n=1 Tax=Acetatifactor sp. TaxID=1872090 RepID=UPI004057A987